MLPKSPLTSACRLAATSEAGELPWKFYFKLYCFLDTDHVPKDSVEFAFMFEQVTGALGSRPVSGRPCHCAACRAGRSQQGRAGARLLAAGHADLLYLNARAGAHACG